MGWASPGSFLFDSICSLGDNTHREQDMLITKTGSGCIMQNCIVSCMYPSFTTWYNDLGDVGILVKEHLPHDWGRKFPVGSYIPVFLKIAVI